MCVSNTSTYQASAKQGNAKITTDMSKSTTSLLIFNRLLCIGPCAYGGHFPSSHKTSFSGILTRDLVPAYIYLFICLCFNSQLTQNTATKRVVPYRLCCVMQLILITSLRRLNVLHNFVKQKVIFSAPISKRV